MEIQFNFLCFVIRNRCSGDGRVEIVPAQNGLTSALKFPA
jgi:hypothetical protein